jgi:hypothetical protein
LKPLKLRHNGWKEEYSPLPRSLKYGKTYYLAFAGITDSIEFTLKKKKKIRCVWINGTVTYESLKWIRKVVNEENIIHFIEEREEKDVWIPVGSNTSVYQNLETGAFEYFSAGNEDSDYIEQTLKKLEPFKGLPYDGKLEKLIIQAIKTK